RRPRARARACRGLGLVRRGPPSPGIEPHDRPPHGGLDLLDDPEAAAVRDNALDVALLVSGHDEEGGRVFAYLLVLLQARRDAMRAVRVGALADEGGSLGVEVLRALGYSLVDVAEEGFGRCTALVLVHVVSLRSCRLPPGDTPYLSEGLRTRYVGTVARRPAPVARRSSHPSSSSATAARRWCSSPATAELTRTRSRWPQELGTRESRGRTRFARPRVSSPVASRRSQHPASRRC